MPHIFRWTAEKGIAGDTPDAVPRSILASVPELAEAPALLILPPLWDHHGHIAAHGTALEQVDLRGCPSLSVALAKVQSAATENEPSEWLQGFGWDQNRWSNAYPDRRDLDAIVPDRPVLLRRIDGHAGWVNTEALERAGFGDESPDPSGGRLVREGSRLTGIVLDGALNRIEACVPPPDDADLRRRILRALNDLKETGLAGVTDMGLEESHVRILTALDREDALPISVEGFLWVKSGVVPSGSAYEGRRFRVVGAKFFADGALGSRGAALHEDYADQTGERGLLLWDTKVLAGALAEAAAHGLRPAVHAIGDRAVSQVLDAIELSQIPAGARIEHVQIARDEDVGRMSRLGVVASIQPCHYLSDREWAVARLGAGMSDAYRWGTLRRQGIPLLLGTDFPIESPDPVRNFSACMEREDRSERLSLETILEAYGPPRDFSLRPGSTIAAFDPGGAKAHPDSIRLGKCVSVAPGAGSP